MKRPNFFIVGAPKAGTTSLYHYLTGHPEVFLSTPKEVNYFSAEEIEAQGLYYDDVRIGELQTYLELFSEARDEIAVGEASVSYLYYPKTPEKLHAFAPDARIVILLRDPIERGFSHYLMDHRLGLVNLEYAEVVRRSGSHPNLELYYQQYVSLGFYYEQVKRYLDLFGAGQVRIYLSEELKHDTQGVIRDLYAFLGVTADYEPDTTALHNAYTAPRNTLIKKLYAIHGLRKALASLVPDALKAGIQNLLFRKSRKPELDPKLRGELAELYRGDVAKLARLIGRDLSGWCRT